MIWLDKLSMRMSFVGTSVPHLVSFTADIKVVKQRFSPKRCVMTLIKAAKEPIPQPATERMKLAGTTFHHPWNELCT